MSEIEHLLPIHNTLGEGLLWSVAEQALYWVDIHNNCYHRLNTSSGMYETIHVGVKIGVLAQCASGGLVMATQHGFAFWDAQKKELKRINNPEAQRPSMRFNDGAVDCCGRFWAGTMSETDDAEGALYRLDPDGSVQCMISGVTVPNGIGWSPDNTVMYFTDSAQRTIYAYDFDAEHGTIAHCRVLVSAPDAPYVPDGLTVDGEGYLWSCCWDGGRILRYDPTGKLERVIDVPVPRPTSCIFGGPDLDELYITSARIGLTDEELSIYPYSGDLFRLKMEMRGIEKFQFAG